VWVPSLLFSSSLPNTNTIKSKKALSEKREKGVHMDPSFPPRERQKKEGGEGCGSFWGHCPSRRTLVSAKMTPTSACLRSCSANSGKCRVFCAVDHPRCWRQKGGRHSMCTSVTGSLRTDQCLSSGTGNRRRTGRGRREGNGTRTGGSGSKRHHGRGVSRGQGRHTVPTIFLEGGDPS